MRRLLAHEACCVIVWYQEAFKGARRCDFGQGLLFQNHGQLKFVGCYWVGRLGRESKLFAMQALEYREMSPLERGRPECLAVRVGCWTACIQATKKWLIYMS